MCHILSYYQDPKPITDLQMDIPQVLFSLYPKNTLTYLVRESILSLILKYLAKKMKQSTITFKTTLEIKEALEKLAKQGFRSRSAQIEMIVVKYLEKQGVDGSEQVKKNDSK